MSTHDDDVEGAAGECIPRSTSLVDGEACSVRVLFSPSRREVLTGSLTISSPLAGATVLPPAGRGIVPPLLVVERELNFGRMLTGASGVRTLAIANDGDEPLLPPTLDTILVDGDGGRRGSCGLDVHSIPRCRRHDGR